MIRCPRSLSAATFSLALARARRVRLLGHGAGARGMSDVFDRGHHATSEGQRGHELDEERHQPKTPWAMQFSTIWSSLSEAWSGYSKALPITSAPCTRPSIWEY